MLLGSCGDVAAGRAFGKFSRLEVLVTWIVAAKLLEIDRLDVASGQMDFGVEAGCFVFEVGEDLLRVLGPSEIASEFYVFGELNV